jgi:hypothetical protein
MCNVDSARYIASWGTQLNPGEFNIKKLDKCAFNLVHPGLLLLLSADHEQISPGEMEVYLIILIT